MMSIISNLDISKYKNPKYDYIDLITGKRLKSGDFVDESTVIGKMAVVLGEKEPVELFDSYYTKGFTRSKKLAAFHLVDKRTVMETARLIALYTPNQNIPDYILKLIPEINNDKTYYILNTLRDGRRIILIKAQNREELIDMIKKLPDDFLDKDYLDECEELNNIARDNEYKNKINNENLKTEKQNKKGYFLEKATYNISINGEIYKDDQLPVLTLRMNGGDNTYIPLRKFCELFNIEIIWDQETQTAIIKYKQK